MSLTEEIEQNRRKIHTDAYPMSIGEMINLYNDEEIDIHPEFQRIYRWNIEQKSKLIESILLGIPLPSIFVAQREDGIWDVVDGLQRLSTIFSFLGILKDVNDKILPPLELTGTEYLPSLDGKVWNHPTDSTKEIPTDWKRAFKREKIDLKIIKRESESNTKYDLFQRLNTGGSTLSPQEVRNCLLIMIDNERYEWLQKLSEYENFRTCLPITDKAENEQYYMELALRYFVYRYSKSEIITQYRDDISNYITDQMRILFDPANTFDMRAEEENFKRVFDLFNEMLAENSFRKYNSEKVKYEGGFSVALYEVLAIGVGASNKLNNNIYIKEKIKEVSESLPYDHNYQESTYHGIRALNRCSKLIEYGKSLFIDED